MLRITFAGSTLHHQIKIISVFVRILELNDVSIVARTPTLDFCLKYNKLQFITCKSK